MALKKRSEMDSAYQWDLTHIFENDEAFTLELNGVMQDIERLSDLPGRLHESAAALKEVLDRIDAVEHRFCNVANYAMLKAAGDNSDPHNRDMEEKIYTVSTSIAEKTAFLSPEILAMEPEKLESFMQDEGLAPYRHFVGDIVRMRAHTLDAQRESLLAMLGDAAAAPSNIFSMFESVDMTFPDLTDKDGNALPLSHGTYSLYRESRDRDFRKQNFATYLGQFEKFNATLAATYSGAVKLDCYFAKVRGFESALESSLYADNIPVTLYNSLTTAIHNAFPVMEHYLKLRKEALGVDELHMYDLYVPIVENVDIHLTFEEACDLVRKALAPMGEDYIQGIERAMTERWIDVYENKGKTTGAFSEGVYDVHPYVLLNFSGKLDDAFTLAHELGHAMHSYFSDKTQDYANHDYTLFVAEVASTVNEMLLSEYLLETSEDPAVYAYVLNHLLEGFRTTVFRQTLFAEFERLAHEKYEAGEALTGQALNAIFHKLDEMYYPGVVVDDFMDVEWSLIPHFYRAFYVYKYATGFTSAVAIADSILHGDGLTAYKKFLSMGGSDYPLNELRVAGVDLTTPAPIEHALNIFDRRILELAKALNIPEGRIL